MLTKCKNSKEIELQKQLEGFIQENIQNEGYKTLLNNILSIDMVDNRLYKIPASNIHNTFENGLMTHILNMLSIAKTLNTLYKFDTDLVYTSVILHDIGKVYLFNDVNELNVMDNLVGHATLGYTLIEKEINKVTQLDSNTKLLLLHAIAVHSSKDSTYTYEAELLKRIDQLDASLSNLSLNICNTPYLELTNKLPIFNRKYISTMNKEETTEIKVKDILRSDLVTL